MIAWVCGVAALLLGRASPAPAQWQPEPQLARFEVVHRRPPPFTGRTITALDVPRWPSVQAQMRYATACKLASWRSRPELAPERRRCALAAFRAVRAYFPGERNCGAEAAFRAGELLRAAGQNALAAGEFRAASELGARSEFGVRASLELGHIERRAGRWSQAFEAFETVLAGSAAACWRDDAALGLARVHADLGREEDARRWLMRVAEHSEDPLRRVRAYDECASSWADARDLEAAAGVLALARNALGELAQEETALGRRVALALERMRCIRRLELAVEHRRRERVATEN